MCGITGFIDYKSKASESTLRRMTSTLAHRGPNDMGVKFYDTQSLSLGLGHTRLSILDLSSGGHQPMEYNQYEIVYNGEVYNFKEIKSELEARHYTFISHSDTEVILKAYAEWGIDAVKKFNGMFAIAIYDKEKEKLILIRDRVGVKPLYWYWDDGLFMFSSELKSFHKNKSFKKDINIDALGGYLQYGYIMQPYSIYENTYKLKSGHYLEIDIVSKNISEKKYWDIIEFYNKPKLILNEEDAISETEKLFKSAFKYRMVSDVPVGVFLSGGYDSSTVAAMLQDGSDKTLNTFTIGFEEKGFDEAPYAKQVASHIGSNHTEYYCTQKDALEIIPTLATIYDEPFGDSSQIPTILVSQLAKKKVDVALSADGGDEVFAGYGKYDKALKYSNIVSKIPLPLKKSATAILNRIDAKNIPFSHKIGNVETKLEKIKALLSSENIIDIMKYLSQPYTDIEINKLLIKKRKLLTNSFDNSIHLNNMNDDINQMLAIDSQTYMIDDILTKVDRATMSVSLEGREPLLDFRILEFVAQLPSSLKYRNGDKKWLLKQITHKYLPKELMDRPKMGFAVPLMSWFKDELKEYFLNYLSRERLGREGIFNVEEVILQRDAYFLGKKENVQRLWFILMFEMWYEKWQS